MALKHVEPVPATGVPSHQFLVTDGEGNFWIVSDAVNVLADETMVFKADETGEVTDWWGEGVAYPAGSHEDALNSAGLTLE
jgi:hypothetical protein